MIFSPSPIRFFPNGVSAAPIRTTDWAFSWSSIAVAEQYPDLKANQNFLELQAQLEGTENRIAVARTRFNDATRQYNVTIRRFPANLIAGMFGFDQKAYFAAEEGAQTVPEVKF